ncbi:MAG: hypothetical protein GX234_06315 [Clostridiales bacterium]|nr:hypothetical protein [Clostridiales bacterium]
MKEKVYALLEEVNKKIVQYEGENMLEDEIVESMEIMDIVVKLEEELGIEIGPEYIVPEYFMTKDTIVKMVEDVRKEQ